MAAATGLLLLATTKSLHAQTGTLEMIRSDVRDGQPSAPAGSSPTQSSNSRSSSGGSDDDSPFDELKADVSLHRENGRLSRLVAKWVPIFFLDDNFNFVNLHQFPYDETPAPQKPFRL